MGSIKQEANKNNGRKNSNSSHKEKEGSKPAKDDLKGLDCEVAEPKATDDVSVNDSDDVSVKVIDDVSVESWLGIGICFNLAPASQNWLSKDEVLVVTVA